MNPHPQKKEERMATVTIEEAQAQVPWSIERLQPGEEILITRDQKPVARLTAEGLPKRAPRRPGNCQGMITIVAEDDEHLKDFAEYMG
jgi:antitoxin (DNA-binding transcriptional repressor) of toxin-antitoxin stability system